MSMGPPPRPLGPRGRKRSSTSLSSISTSYSTGASTRPDTSASARPGSSATTTATGTRSRGRPRTSLSTLNSDQQIICAISESRGISPIVGLAFINLSTTEAVVCQISDNQTYTRTEQKLNVYEPSEILFMSTAVQPKSKLYLLVENNLPEIRVTPLDRKFWAETLGVEYVQHLALRQDLEAIKIALEGNYYATCCFAAVLKYIDLELSFTFSYHSLRIKYEPSEDTMMIDSQTRRSLELIQNLQNPTSKECLYGILNQTHTSMGARRLRINLLQPSTDKAFIEHRYDALTELTTRETMFHDVRTALKSFVDVDRVLTVMTLIPKEPSVEYFEESINNIIMLKQFVKNVKPVYEAIRVARSELLVSLAHNCRPEQTGEVEKLIDDTINADITYQKSPLALRNQRTYAVKSGVNGLLDVARQTYKEVTGDIEEHINVLGEEHELPLEIKYETARQYYIRLPAHELEERNLPDVFVNVYRKNKIVECQTLYLIQLNRKITDAHHEVLSMTSWAVQDLTEQIREVISPLFKTSEAIALLDMLASFAQVITSFEYVRPGLTDAFTLKGCRHPIIERLHSQKFVPNDACALPATSRFQIITGCNMSGKSTYIRSLALVTIMAQAGCFVPASWATIPIRHSIFARISLDDNIEANVSTFSAEMRETAFILNNIDRRSMAIVDELGRGTSTRDGLCIAIAIAEAMVESKAYVWFATHFTDLAKILSERAGVINLHLAVDIQPSQNKMNMLYNISEGYNKQENYGIALAKVLDMPPGIVEIAEKVSKQIREKVERQKKMSKTILLARKRKLILGLREQLLQAKEGTMDGRVLLTWMQNLQDEFVNRMHDLEEQIEQAEADAEGGDLHDEAGAEEDDRHDEGSETTEPRGDVQSVVSQSTDSRYKMSGALNDSVWGRQSMASESEAGDSLLDA